MQTNLASKNPLIEDEKNDKNVISHHIEKIVNECIVDAIGFAGLHLFANSMNLHPVIGHSKQTSSYLNLQNVPGYTWGNDVKGRKRYINHINWKLTKLYFIQFRYYM